MKRILVVCVIIILYLGCKKGPQSDNPTAPPDNQTTSSQDIRVAGGQLLLLDVGFVVFDSNTFTANTRCELKRTTDTSTNNIWTAAAAIFSMKETLPNQIRINTGKNEPLKPVHVKIFLPASLV